MKLQFTFLLILFSFSVLGQKSILNDSKTLQKIEQGIDSIYDFQFESVTKIETDLNQHYPNHPLPPLFHAIKVYWQYFPIIPGSKFEKEFTDNITLSIQRSDKMLDDNSENHEAIFLNLMARLLIMQYYADNHMSSKVIPYVHKAYTLAKKGFDLNQEVTDFYFTTGLYNYYREAYPVKHPIYKPIAYFFKDGNMKLGIKQLEYNSKNGIFLDAESLSFLVFISLNFEENYKKSLKYTRDLYKTYPNNLLFLSYRIITLLLLNKYNKADQLLTELKNKAGSNQFFQMMIKIYRGIIEEKKNKNLELAEKLYWEGIKLGENYKPFANDRISYAYFGLSRIWKNKDPKKATEYREKAMKLSSYKHLTFD